MAQEEGAGHRLTRFVTSAKGAVLTIGALAGAVGAMIALLPKHEHTTLKASFGNVAVSPNVDLEEYEERFASRPVAKVGGPNSPPLLTVPYRLVDASSASGSSPKPVAETETAPAETSGEPTTTSDSTTTTETSDTTEDSTTTTTTTTTEETSSSTEEPPSPAPAPFKETKDGLARDGNGTNQEEEQDVVNNISESQLSSEELEAESPEGESATVAVPDACNSPPCAMTPMIDNALTYDSDPAKAAHAVAAAFADSRGRVVDGKLYPSGVAVSYTIDLAGWAGREARLEWSLWSQSEGRPLPKPWLHNVIAKEIEPKVDNGSFSGYLWIPAPPRRGDYVVHLTVYDSDHVEHAETQTAPFH